MKLVVGEVKDVQVTLESETLLSLGSPDSAHQKFLIYHKKNCFLVLTKKLVFRTLEEYRKFRGRTETLVWG